MLEREDLWEVVVLMNILLWSLMLIYSDLILEIIMMEYEEGGSKERSVEEFSCFNLGIIIF